MRSYGQYCGLARALEVVGDRWNLLIVRELLIGPARYRDLLAGLPGIATNLLADRLRDLESTGVIERRLVGKGSAVEYVLTPWGAQLREPLEGLIRWSVPLMVNGPAEADVLRPEWLALAVPALLAPRTNVREPVTIGLDFGGRVFRLDATDDGLTVGPDDGAAVAATVHAQAPIVLGMAAGALALDDARSLGLVEVDGNEAAVREVFAS